MVTDSGRRFSDVYLYNGRSTLDSFERLIKQGQDAMSAELLPEGMRKIREAEEATMNAEATDPLSVECPVCSEPPGEMCIDHYEPPGKIEPHDQRFVDAANQARKREIGTWKTTVPVSETASNPIDVDCRKCGASAGHDCIDAVTSALMKERSHTIRHYDTNEASGRLIADIYDPLSVPCPKCGTPHHAECVSYNGPWINKIKPHEERYIEAAKQAKSREPELDVDCPACGAMKWTDCWSVSGVFLVDGGSHEARRELARKRLEKPTPAAGQVWRGKHKGAANVELVRAGSIYHSFEAKLITSGSILEAYPVMDIGFTFWATKGWFDNATLVREAKNGTKKNTGHSLDKRKQQFAEQWRDNPPALPPVTLGDLAIDSVTPIAPPNQKKIEFISGSDVKVTAPVRITINRTHCTWCGTDTDGSLAEGDLSFCCNVHKSEYENNPGGSWLAEHSKAVARSVKKGIEKTLNLPPKETVTVAGITMDRARYEERCAAYAACDHGCAAFEPTSLLPERDWSKPEPEPDQPWSCDDADYVVMG